MASEELIKLLRRVELFDGLTDAQIDNVAEAFDEQPYKTEAIVFREGDVGDRLYVIRSGFVEVVVSGKQGAENPVTLVNLGSGQLFGEMALVDRGKRSATVRSVDNETMINSLSRSDFGRLCEEDTALGYIVMRNLAADLSFKLRHRNLTAGRD